MASAVQAGEMMVNIRELTTKFPNRVISNSPILMQSRSYFTFLYCDCCHGNHVYILQIQPRKENVVRGKVIRDGHAVLANPFCFTHSSRYEA